ncbi:DUF4112 domain-containing protein [Puniceibacterium sediminis]|uniref:DUF4112 domain-containing protein n=1 Tax=Puniceibacterium sediminis TaxID=1608407 RepID=A0A238W686_9RHOB|nr:DUF4112 domain-containing protein [Puniceibacterium sediminis]SNR41941.1 protein of unknown function [Puniceibacterium sediminis]
MNIDSDYRAVARAETLARRMDSAFRVPLTGIRIGWDSILGFIPGIGDTVTLLPLAYHIHTAQRLEVPRKTMARMAVNSGIDWLIGLIPLLGDIFDVGFKSNLRNAALLRAHVDQRHAPNPSAAYRNVPVGSTPPVQTMA